MAQPFKELFCQQSGCLPENFETELLTRSFYQHARPWLPFLRLIDAVPVHEGRQLIQEIGRSTSASQVEDAISFYQHRMQHDASFAVFRFKLRISLQQLLNIYQSVMAKYHQKQMELFGHPGNIIKLPENQPLPESSASNMGA